MPKAMKLQVKDNNEEDSSSSKLRMTRSKLMESQQSLVLDAVKATSATKLGDGEWAAPKDNASISGQYSVLNPNKKTLEKKVEVTEAATDADATDDDYVGVIAALKKMNKEPLLALFKANGYDDDFVKVLDMSSDVEMKLLSCVGIEKSGERFKLIRFVQNFHAAEEPKPKRFKTEKKEKENSSRNVDKKIKKEP